MLSLRKVIDTTVVLAGIVFLAVEVWRDRTRDFQITFDFGDCDLGLSAGPPGPFAFVDDPDVDDYMCFTTMRPLFSTRPAIYMVC